MTKITIFKNLVDGVTYRAIDESTELERRDMLTGEWLPSKRDIRDVRNQSASNVIIIGEEENKEHGQASTVTFSARLCRFFKRGG